MSIKINSLEVENVKRVKAVRIEPSASGLTVIGGRNGQGKTSVLDAITWALGGDRYKPSSPQRDGSVIPPSLHIELSNGLVVERKGKNSALTVTDTSGTKGGQQLLNEFVEQLALDLPKFLQASGREKASTLLQIIGVGDKLAELERQEAEAYNRRRTIGQIADQKTKFAKEMTTYPGMPDEPVSASELIRQQQAILAENGENQRKRQQLRELEVRFNELQQQLAQLTKQRNDLMASLEVARKSAFDLQDESTQALEASIATAEETNRKVRANLDREKAEEDAKTYRDQYTAMTTELDALRQSKLDLLEGATLPLPGLSVEDGELTYNGHRWDGMSSAEQLRVATAIVRQLNPKCGFVLLDKLEAMDLETLREFGAWLEAEGLQAIATRVSTGSECSLIIDDGYSVTTMQYQATEDQTRDYMESQAGADPEPAPTWKAGEF